MPAIRITPHESGDKAAAAAPLKPSRTKYVAPVVALSLWAITLIVCFAASVTPAKALAGSMIVGSTIAWLDARFLSLELTSLIIMAFLVCTKVLTFAEALGGAAYSSIWLVWVGGLAGAAFDRCQLSDWVVAKTMAGAGTGNVGLLPLITRVGALTFVASMAIPSAVSRNLLLVPLAKRFRSVGELSDERVEAVAAALIFGATKPGMGLLTGYVTSMLVASVYDGVMASPAGGLASPPTIAWAKYAMAMMPVWGVLMVPLIILTVFGVYKPLVAAADARARKEGASKHWTLAKKKFHVSRTFEAFDASAVGVATFAFESEPAPKPGSTAAGALIAAEAAADEKKAPVLSVEGKRAITYLTLAVLAWCLLGGTFEGVTVDKGAVGVCLVILLYAPRPVGVADVTELRTAKSYGVLIYLCAVIALEKAVTKAGITADIAEYFASWGGLGAMSPFMQYLVIAWAIALLTVPTNEVLASVMGSSIMLSYVTSATYSGPLTPLRVALTCCCPGCLCLTPTHCPPIVVGLGMSKAVGGLKMSRLYTLLIVQSVVEVLVFYPLAILIIANV